MSTQTRIKHETTQGLACPAEAAEGEASVFNHESKNGHVKTSSDSQGLIVENPDFTMTPDTAQSLDALRASHLKARTLAHESIITPEMRRESTELRLRALRTFSGDNGGLEILKGELRDGAL